VNELADRIISHYERHARYWDADRRKAAWNDKPWHDRFIAKLPADATVLDLGCGSGAPIAQYMAECGRHVIGVDTSPTLVSLCRERLPDQEWIVADMRSLSLGRRFDGVLAWDSFFHLKPNDQRNMFDVFAKHVTPSGALMFNAGPALGEAIGSYRGDALYHASLSAEEYEALLDNSGFNIIARTVEDWRDGGGRTVWLAQSRV
jgi:SAM-dependent methyltransferase